MQDMYLKDGRSFLYVGDVGRKLVINIPNLNIIRVCYETKEGSTKDVEVEHSGDVFYADIPNTLLSGAYSALTCYAIATDGEYAYTASEAHFEIKDRQKSEGYSPTDQQLITWDYIETKALEYMNQTEVYMGHAIDSADNASSSAESALQSKNASAQSEANARASETAAKQSETNAKASEEAAKQSEDNAQASADNASSSAESALQSKNASAQSESNAKLSETNAKASEEAAKQSEDNAQASADNASSSAESALQSKNASAQSEANARASETAAKQSETNAKASEEAAKQSEDNAQASADNASSSAESALQSKNASAQSESNAKLSETNAKASEEAAKQSEDNAQASADNASSSAESALQSKNASAQSEANARASETAAKQSETNAKASETNAKASETAAKQTLAEAQQIVAGKADKTYVDSNLATKADKSELAVERARIDSLSTLPEGSTTGDAELIGIRIGADGVTYPNAGEAVRTQILNEKTSRETAVNELKGDLVEISEEIGYVNKVFSSTSGYFIQPSLNKVSNGAFSYSEPIFVKKGWSLEFTATGTTTPGTMSMITKANSDGTLLESLQGNFVGEYIYNLVMDNDCYIVVSYRNDSAHKLVLKSDYSIEEIKKDVSALNNFNIKEIEEYTVNTGMIGSNGEVSYHTELVYSSPIYVKKGCTIKYGVQGVRNVIALISKYEGGTYRPLVISVDSEYVEGVYTVVENGYYVFCSNKNVDYYFKTVVDVKNIFNEVEETIDRKYFTMFHKIGVIGDSLSSGVIIKSNVSYHMYDYSWISHIARRNGIDYECYSQGGMTAKSWLNNQGGNRDKFVNDVEVPHAVFIALGSNDTRETYPVGSASDSITTESFCGYVNKIISIVWEKNAHIPIFLMTPYSSAERYVPFANAVRDIAKAKENVYFIDYANNSNGITSDSEDFRITNGGHFTMCGYEKCSSIIENLSNAQIDNNLGAFAYNCLYLENKIS